MASFIQTIRVIRFPALKLNC